MLAVVDVLDHNGGVEGRIDVDYAQLGQPGGYEEEEPSSIGRLHNSINSKVIHQCCVAIEVFQDKDGVVGLDVASRDVLGVGGSNNDPVPSAFDAELIEGCEVEDGHGQKSGVIVPVQLGIPDVIDQVGGVGLEGVALPWHRAGNCHRHIPGVVVYSGVNDESNPRGI